jgi:N-6 DNA Methylase
MGAVRRPRHVRCRERGTEVASDDVDIRALRDSLAVDDPRERTAAVLGALAWDRPAAYVEWAPHTREVGRFTVGDFPTSASIVDSSASTWQPAWHAGFRWCISAQAGALHWFDLKKRLHWTGTGAALSKRVLAGLTPSGFERTAQLAPLEVTPEPAPELLAKDPSRLVGDRILGWWNLYCEHHIKSAPAVEEADLHKATFTRFMAGVLLLRTIEDTERIEWLPKGKLRESVSGANASSFRSVVSRATTRLNSRVISRIADVSFDVARTIVRESYEIGVNFAALDVDPVGTFYEEILGVEYVYSPKRQRELFGNNLDTTADRTARRTDGVYYTPRIYADTLARSLVRPRVRAAERIEELPVVADIAAGSGELLCAAFREVLTEPMWCKPDVAWQVLDTKLQAIDKNPLAPQLCALNLLRTAVRFVPELFDGRCRLPPLDDNLRVGNALQRRDLDALPAPDVVLINPPFHSPNRWRRPDLATAIPALTDVSAYPHQAVAFFAAAVHLAPKGAGLGVVMPSTIFTGALSAPWRRWLAERVRLDLVVANYGTPFRDVDSYAGLVVGRKRTSSCFRIGTLSRVITNLAGLSVLSQLPNIGGSFPQRLEIPATRWWPQGNILTYSSMNVLSLFDQTGGFTGNLPDLDLSVLAPWFSAFEKKPEADVLPIRSSDLYFYTQANAPNVIGAMGVHPDKMKSFMMGVLLCTWENAASLDEFMNTAMPGWLSSTFSPPIQNINFASNAGGLRLVPAMSAVPGVATTHLVAVPGTTMAQAQYGGARNYWIEATELGLAMSAPVLARIVASVTFSASAAGKPVASNIDSAVATLMLSDSNGGFESDGLLCGNGGIVEGGAAEFIARPSTGDCVCVTFSQEPLVFDNEPSTRFEDILRGLDRPQWCR